jgi:hypothetical protein
MPLRRHFTAIPQTTPSVTHDALEKLAQKHVAMGLFATSLRDVSGTASKPPQAPSVTPRVPLSCPSPICLVRCGRRPPSRTCELVGLLEWYSPSEAELAATYYVVCAATVVARRSPDASEYFPVASLSESSAVDGRRAMPELAASFVDLNKAAEDFVTDHVRNSCTPMRAEYRFVLGLC